MEQRVIYALLNNGIKEMSLARYTSFLLILVLGIGNVFGQQISILEVIFVGDTIELKYDLTIDSKESQTYDIILLSSHDNFSKPLKFVSGEIGTRVLPGNDKKILWAAKRELGSTKGSIQLEIRGNPSAPFLKVLNPSSVRSVRRGESIEIAWKTDYPGDLNISVFNGEGFSEAIVSKFTGSEFLWTVPNSFPKTASNQFIFEASDSQLPVVKSEVFKIKPKFGWGIKVLPLVLFGSVAAILLSQDDSSPESAQGIPRPISPN